MLSTPAVAARVEVDVLPVERHQQRVERRPGTGGQLTAPTLTAYWKEVRARARLDHDFYVATKHYGVWYMKVILGLRDAAIAAQAGWSEAAITKMVQTYAHAVDERRLDEIDAAFVRDAERDA